MERDSTSNEIRNKNHIKSKNYKDKPRHKYKRTKT